MSPATVVTLTALLLLWCSLSILTAAVWAGWRELGRRGVSLEQRARVTPTP